MADWKGRLEDRPGKIKIEVLPGDPCDINQLLEDLAAADHLILRYQVEGRRLIQVTTFVKHQHVSEKEKRSECLPPPPQEEEAGTGALDADHGSLQPKPVAREASFQPDAGTKPVSFRNDPVSHRMHPRMKQDRPSLLLYPLLLYPLLLYPILPYLRKISLRVCARKAKTRTPTLPTSRPFGRTTLRTSTSDAPLAAGSRA